MPRILVVDDEPQILKTLEALLNESGFEAITVGGGSQALEIICSQEPIDLIILDMKMPEVNGLAVLETMQKMGKDIPVIILTGDIDLNKESDKLKSLGYSDENILTKPVKLSLLLGRIKGFLS